VEVLDAYVAGLIDGEGTITLSHNNKGDAYRTPVVSMTSTTKELVELLHREYGGSVRFHRTYRARHSDSFIWSVRHNRALKMLERIAPYLRVPEKVTRANLILCRYKLVTPRNGKYSDVQRESKIEFEHLFFHPSTP
jgi:hypothetical protein